MNDTHIVVFFQCFSQYRQQTAVNFDGRNVGARLGKGLCKRADTRTDFQDRIAVPHTGSRRNITDNLRPDEEILPPLLTRPQIEPFYYIPDNVGICYFRFFHLNSPHPDLPARLPIRSASRRNDSGGEETVWRCRNRCPEQRLTRLFCRRPQPCRSIRWPVNRQK